MHRHPHILNAATNLLGICFVIISALKIGNLNSRSFGDEATWISAFFFLVSITVSYMAIRNNDAKAWQTSMADWSFMAGVVSLTAAVALLAIFL
jgi:hypothetical protein